jgi:hypothetical protein
MSRVLETFGIKLRDSDYCQSCGSLMAPWGLVDRSDQDRRLCVECEEDARLADQAPERPATGRSTPPGAGGWPTTDLSDLTPDLTLDCGALWRRVRAAKIAVSGRSEGSGSRAFVFLLASGLPELVQPTGAGGRPLPCGPL